MGNGAHIVLTSFPVQGHINPTLQFAKRLARLGAKVNFCTTSWAQRQISVVAEGLTITSFSDVPDDNEDKPKTPDDYVAFLRKRTSEKIKEIIITSADEGCPVTCVAYTHLLPWAGDVAKSFGIPFALLWIQPAATLDIYYHYFNGYGDAISDTVNDPLGFVDLPCLPRLTTRDLPSFLLPTSWSLLISSQIPSLKEQVLALDAETNPRVLVNTFDALEPEILKSIKKYNLVGIGPLMPSAFLDQKDLHDRSFGGDLHQEWTTDYGEWLNSKPKSSVVYISFGSMLDLPKEQVEEIAYGLLESECPFLWVIKNIGKENKEEDDEYTISCIKELKQNGMIVPWCSQLEVLSHPSLGCFITHCGWNSTLESLVMGVPVVAFPQWADQPTNAKMIGEVWKNGVRVREGEENSNGKTIVNRKEIKRCIEMVMNKEEKGKEVRQNAMKWKDLAMEAVMVGGSSDLNLKAFVKEVGGACS